MIPGYSYMNLVRQFAIAKGLNFFTVEQQLIARRLYEERAALLN
jgi:hypothetical protein